MRKHSNIVDVSNLRGLMAYDRYQMADPVPVAEGMFGAGPVRGQRGPDSGGAVKGRRGPDSRPRFSRPGLVSMPLNGFGQTDISAISTGAAIAGTAVLIGLNFLFMAYAAKIGTRWAGCGR